MNIYISKFDRIIFKLFGKKIIRQDFELDIGCKVTAYHFMGTIYIDNIEYFDAKTSSTVKKGPGLSNSQGGVVKNGNYGFEPDTIEQRKAIHNLNIQI